VNLVNVVNVEGMTVGPRRPGPTVASELASSAERSFRCSQCAIRWRHPSAVKGTRLARNFIMLNVTYTF
jgi:hypothetical protein